MPKNNQFEKSWPSHEASVEQNLEVQESNEGEGGIVMPLSPQCGSLSIFSRQNFRTSCPLFLRALRKDAADEVALEMARLFSGFPDL